MSGIFWAGEGNKRDMMALTLDRLTLDQPTLDSPTLDPSTDSTGPSPNPPRLTSTGPVVPSLFDGIWTTHLVPVWGCLAVHTKVGVWG